MGAVLIPLCSRGQFDAVTLTAKNDFLRAPLQLVVSFFEATTSDDNIELSRNLDNAIVFASKNATFETFSVQEPTAGLRIETGDGDDSVLLSWILFHQSYLSTGQRGVDAITIPAGEFVDLGFSVDTVSSEAIVQNLTYTTTDGDVGIERDSTTSRLLIRDANGEALLLDPTEHFTVIAGGQSADDTIESFGRNTNLTHVSMRQLVLTEDFTLINNGGGVNPRSSMSLLLDGTSQLKQARSMSWPESPCRHTRPEVTRGTSH